jgi:diguanylate cyclase (GGDEF)-like protein/PAS domain S-box-containing protein
MLPESDQKQRTLFRLMPTPTAVYQKQADDFVLVDWNEAMVEWTRGGISALQGKTIREIYDAQSEMPARMARCFEEKHNLQVEMPYRMITTGQDRYVSFTFVYVPSDTVLIHAVDITERQRADQKLREQAKLLDLTYDAIYVRDMQGRVTFWNRGAEEMYGWKKEEAEGQVSYKLLRTDYPKPLEEIEADIVREGRWEGELVHSARTGTRIVVASRWALQLDAQGNPVAVLEINNDITEQKRAQEQIRAYATELEQRVAERTAEWEHANRELEQEIGERKRAEEELAQANEHLRDWANQLEQRNREFVLLNEMGDLLESCLNVQEAYRVIAQSASKLFPGDCGALYVIANSRDLAESVATWGDLPASVIEPVFAPNDCWALRRGRTHVVQDAPTGLCCSHLKPGLAASSVKSYLCAPLIAQGELLGLFHLQNGSGSLSEAKQQLAVAVAEHLGLALASLSLRETLRQQALRDPLTGLFNRRYFVDMLERELHRAARHQGQLGVLMLDVDNLKGVNDTHTHLVGDAMLRSLGQLLGTHVRKEDIVCRYAGDEFVIILPDTTLLGAQLRAEQLRQEIERLNIEYQGHSYGNPSASFGVAVFSADGTTAEEVLRAADEALYQAKSNGRNRVCVAGGSAA